MKLTKKDCSEIYYALESKLTAPITAGDSSFSFAWRKHLKRIIKKIGPDGQNLKKGNKILLILRGGGIFKAYSNIAGSYTVILDSDSLACEYSSTEASEIQKKAIKGLRQIY
ncbi:MAG: hypothetical protein WC417_06345 [Candidatus Omnitrophota bacterium]|jgi:hypothetical protein